MANPSNAPLPQQLALEAKMLAEHPQSGGLGTPASHFVGYIVSAKTADERANRFSDVRAALGGSDLGYDAMIEVMRTGQAPILNAYGGGQVSSRMHEAFAHNVADGRFADADVRALVASQARLGGSEQLTQAAGAEHPGLTTAFARTSSYFEQLGGDARSRDVRSTFVEASLESATAIANVRPATAAQLYAQAANSLANLTTAEIQSHLIAMTHREGNDAIGRFAIGATSGLAERAKPVDFPTPNGHVEYRADGLSRLMLKLNESIVESRAVGRADTQAEAMSAQLFTGTSTFLTAARGTELDHDLAANDACTGLRHALNDTMSRNFPAVLRQNSERDGEGLTTGRGGGLQTMESYARFEFSATDDAHGRDTAGEAQRVIGTTLGTIAGDVLKGERDGGRDLRHDFGPATFGDSAHASANATTTLAQMMGAVKNGLNQDFDQRYDANLHAQHETQRVFETSAMIAKTIGTIAGKVGGAEAVPFVEAAAKIAETIGKNVPLQTTVVSDRTVAYDELASEFRSALSRGRANEGLIDGFRAGTNDATTSWVGYVTDRSQTLANHEAETTQRTTLGRILSTTHIVAPPQSVAPQAKPESIAPERVADRLDRAIADYNRDHQRGPLPPRRTVSEWDGSPRQGTILRLTDDTYAISTGRGSYETFDTGMTHGVHPTAGGLANLGRDGTLHDVPSHALSHGRS